VLCRFHARVVFEGVWGLTLLTYSHLVYTSVSIVNCRDLNGEMVSISYLFYVLPCVPPPAMVCQWKCQMLWKWSSWISIPSNNIPYNFCHSYSIYSLHCVLRQDQKGVRKSTCKFLHTLFYTNFLWDDLLQHKVSLMANNLRITLTSSYRDNYVFWPVVELVRRFVFVTAVVATPGDLVCVCWENVSSTYVLLF